MAIMMSELKNVLTWTTEDLNAVLMKGDELYTCMRLQGKINDDTGRGHVSIAELPTVHTLKQVIECIRDCYEQKGHKIADLSKRCITLKYLHACNNECKSNCYLSGNLSCKLWICYTCHRKILRGKLPEESVTNNMHLVEIPKELKCLNSLEQHLIALNIPFLRLLCLPRGQQRGVHGPVVCVPVNTTKMTNILPRNECNDHMIKIKLKRKLTYKSHYEYKYVHTDHVRNALWYLVKQNKFYNDVEFNEQWVNSLSEPDDIQSNANDEMDDDDNVSDKSGDEVEEGEELEIQPEEDLSFIKEQNGLLSDTSVQPVDIGSEVIDQHFHDVLNVAPAEENAPKLDDEANDPVVADFIDTYITCETPPEQDTELFETVNSVQKHKMKSKLIKNSYEGMACRVVREGQLRKSFQVKTGVRQGCHRFCSS
ncbi:uncharacterized protein [Paramisgurnus dabryanus]|uniref:uncharacterized protein n=1 Tax=Paramisgurnus dabryanus TaxID=90735 RepID=UPI0031F381CB